MFERRADQDAEHPRRQVGRAVVVADQLVGKGQIAVPCGGGDVFVEDLVEGGVV